jgi:diaminopimelate epimerase
MNVKFHKYQGAGNDFILIDNRKRIIQHGHRRLFSHWCNRHFGIGADGVILLEKESGYDFRMVYFNSDGRESSMCGNGGRCIIQFAHDVGIIKNHCQFIAIDGPHSGKIQSNRVSLRMADVQDIREVSSTDFILHTGSPHFVRFADDVEQLAVETKGRTIRNSKPFKQQGINVNFAEVQGNKLFVRTYERGVEDETLSCGTGVVASVLALSFQKNSPIGKQHRQTIETRGGLLSVSYFRSAEKAWRAIDLIGPAQRVFSGAISC